jgi:hypothetical protein
MEAEDFGQQKRKEPKINYGRIAWKDVSWLLYSWKSFWGKLRTNHYIYSLESFCPKSDDQLQSNYQKFSNK